MGKPSRWGRLFPVPACTMSPMTTIKELRYWPGDTVSVVVSAVRDPFGNHLDLSQWDGVVTFYDVGDDPVMTFETDISDTGEMYATLTSQDSEMLPDHSPSVSYYTVRISNESGTVYTVQAGKVIEQRI